MGAPTSTCSAAECSSPPNPRKVRESHETGGRSLRLIGSLMQFLVCLPSGSARWAGARGYLRPARCPAGVQPLAKVVLATAGEAVGFDDSGTRMEGHVLPLT